MHQRRQQKSHKRRRIARQVESADAAVVDVSEQEFVHGPVPVARVLVPGHGVPPVAVETTVGEARDFGEDVEDAFPDDVPGEELFDE